MSAHIDVQMAAALDVGMAEAPSAGLIRAWAEATLRSTGRSGGICIRVVGREEGEALNARFRNRQRATNVLAFAADVGLVTEAELLGDIAICAPVVCDEAPEADARLRHWAHLVIHGVLHLVGFDHQTEAEARRMESREASLLAELGFAVPASHTQGEIT